jgi:nucleotide-binding universal stress UspA family protein
MLETILVGTDGSEPAKRAVAFAADLAPRYSARVVLVHVLLRGHMPKQLLKAAEIEHVGQVSAQPAHLVNMPQEIMARVQGASGTQMTLEVLDFIAKGILGGAESHCREQGVERVSTRVEEGNVADRLLVCAHDERADLIVLGTRGLGHVRGVLAGSVSQRMVHLAECSCLLIK